MNATPDHGTPVLPTDVTHHVLAMRTPCAGHTMAHPPTVSTPPPHTHSPCYSGRATLATHALRASPGGYTNHGELAAQCPGRVACQLRGFPHQTPRPHLPGTSETPQHSARSACAPHETPETQTIEWTKYHQIRAYLLQYIHNYLIQGHKRNCECVQMNAAATDIVYQGIGVYAVPRIRPAVPTPWATTAREAHVHAYQPTSSCRMPRPDDTNTVIFADAFGTTGLTVAAGGAALALRPDKTG